jgi:cytochrome c oxidase subunit 2
MHPARGAGANQLAWLGWLACVLFTIVSALVWLALVWFVRRRRGTLAEHAPIETGDGTRWIVVGGIVVPALVFAGLFAMSVPAMTKFPMDHGDQALPLIRVIGHQWWFDSEYLSPQPNLLVHAPTEIHIPTGCNVDIELQSRDVIHSFWIPKLHGKVDLVPGQVNHIRVQADAPGTYEGECGEYCGMQHAHMRLQVVAQSPEDFQKWLVAQREDAVGNNVSAGSDALSKGRAAFESAACPLCHTVRGTPAHGEIGPDLTHVGSRQRIAGGMLENNTGTLTAWIIHAQAFKPGSQMPDLPTLGGEQTAAIAAYLQSLR